MSVINFPILYVPDPDIGRPLFNGQIYVGEPDLDPVSNPKQLNVVQEDGSVVPVSQPFLLSSGGTPTYNGDAVRLDVDGNYSIKIFDKNGSQRYYIENVFEGQPVTGLEIINDLSLPYVFDTVEDMVASSTVFTVGKRIEWQGYYTQSDGGGNWGIVKSGEHNEDGGSIFTLADGKYVEANLKGRVSVRKFGVLGDGEANDTARLLVVIPYCYENAKVAYFPSGNYQTTTLSFTPTGKVVLVGDGRDVSIISMLSTTGTTIQFSSSTLGIDISKISINPNYTANGVGNHGLVFVDCSNVRVYNARIEDANNTGILAFSSDPATPTLYTNIIFERVEVQGRGNTANGLLIVDATYSGFDNCQVYDTTEFALELKNACSFSWMRNSLVSGNDLYALVLGQTSGVGPSNCQISNVTCSAVDGLIEASNGSHNTFSDISCDFLGNPGTINGCVNLSGGVEDYSIQLSNISNLPTNIPLVRFRTNNKRNTVRASYVNKLGAGNTVVFDATTEDNTVIIDTLNVNDVIQSDIDGLIVDNGDGNIVGYSRELTVTARHTNSSNTALGDITNAINTKDKFVGKQVYNVSSGRPVYASGSSAASVWEYSDGTTSNTPS